MAGERPLRGFVFKLIPPRPDFALTMSDEERAVMANHVGYWSGLAETGRALAFGPVASPAGGYGIGIILAEDEAAAEDLRANDPAERSGRGFRTEVLPMLRLVTPGQTYG
jgi:uncharacterized protein YciI